MADLNVFIKKAAGKHIVNLINLYSNNKKFSISENDIRNFGLGFIEKPPDRKILTLQDLLSTIPHPIPENTLRRFYQVSNGVYYLSTPTRYGMTIFKYAQLFIPNCVCLNSYENSTSIITDNVVTIKSGSYMIIAPMIIFTNYDDDMKRMCYELGLTYNETGWISFYGYMRAVVSTDQNVMVGLQCDDNGGSGLFYARLFTVRFYEYK